MLINLLNSLTDFNSAEESSQRDAEQNVFVVNGCLEAVVHDGKRPPAVQARLLEGEDDTLEQLWRDIGGEG
ncbi:hypothetical protein FTUN_6097 [Frigoriglobus tundricola]|uniref:Uncharacterized protein n=1 Tax=Frigoriglobus tundricola TaxID=2774151 RepID=A0A6M5YWM8_9BACT|nr:hypothetical protein FTUN_6097 [Frigoriglobus tundricola]